MAKSSFMLGLIAVISMPLAVRANLITGVLNTTGTVNISAGSIAFSSVSVDSAGQVGDFVALGGTAAALQTLTPYTAGLLPIPDVDFMTFAAAPNISFTLTFINEGIDGTAGCSAITPASGQICTPSTLLSPSPFNLENTSSDSSTLSFSVLGIEVDSITNDTTPVTGVFKATFPSLSFQDFLTVLAAGGTVTNTFTAQFSTPSSAIPEPSSLTQLMIGLSTVGIGLTYRKKL